MIIIKKYCAYEEETGIRDEFYDDDEEELEKEEKTPEKTEEFNVEDVYTEEQKKAAKLEEEKILKPVALNPPEIVDSNIEEDLHEDITYEDLYVEDEATKELAEKIEKEILIENNEQMLNRYYYDESLTEFEREQLLNEVAKKNIATVYYIVNKLRSFQKMVDLDEMASAGMVGYAKAIAKFDPTRGVKLATFAINCIRNEISFCLRKERKHYDNNISMNYTKHIDKNGNDLTIEDTIPDKAMTPEDEVRHQAVRKLLLDNLALLSPLEKYVTIYRHGLDRGILLTQKQIAGYVSMSQANISKIERNCTDKLKDLICNNF